MGKKIKNIMSCLNARTTIIENTKKRTSLLDLVRSLNSKTRETEEFNINSSVSTLPESYFELDQDSHNEVTTSLSSSGIFELGQDSHSEVTTPLPSPEIIELPRVASLTVKTSPEEYSFKRTLGNGQFSTVWAAVHTPNSTVFAVKTYGKVTPLSAQLRKCISREINILRHLSHPNIIKFIVEIPTAKQVHLVFEYFQGKTLFQHIQGRASRQLKESEAKTIFKQVVDAVAYCHSYGVAHRDIRLQNILIDWNNQVKLIDFGFSTCLPPTKQLRVFCGATLYRAPELLKRKDFEGAPADIWALGILLFYLLAGKYPFRGKEFHSQVATGTLVFPDYISLASRALIMKMLRTEPEERVSARSLLTADWFEPDFLG